MSINVDATYRDGVIHPNVPLNLPENTPVRVHVVSRPEPNSVADDEVVALRPQAPKMTSTEFNALIENLRISAPSLPHDFSRADIYSDHD